MGQSHFIMAKDTICNKVIAILNLHISNNAALKQSKTSEIREK